MQLFHKLDLFSVLESLCLISLPHILYSTLSRGPKPDLDRTQVEGLKLGPNCDLEYLLKPLIAKDKF